MDQYSKSYFSDLENAIQAEVPRNLRILKSIQKYKLDGKLLDVGIGTGLFLQLAAKNNWQTYGVDISKYAINLAKKKTKAKLFLGDLAKLNLENNFFDVINMRHSIEHMQSPELVLKNAFKILKPGGLICIATPNSYGLHAKFFGNLWPHLSLPYHLHFFSKDSLSTIVKQQGFLVLELKTEELSSYELFKLTLNKFGIRCNIGNPSKVSLLINQLLANLGWGEGLLIIAQKPDHKNE